MIFDNFGRQIDYLRISVTDRCNLRCRYCMPKKGVSDIGHDQILRYDEIISLVKIFADAGISRIKITGGEPLVRRGIESLIGELYKINGIEEITLTTNGVLLPNKLEQLYRSGIRNINISLDTLDKNRYEEITGFDALAQVLQAVDECLKYDDIKVKINALALAETSPDEVMALAAMARNKAVDVRFIEVMPLGMGRMVKGRSQEEILKFLTEEFGQAREYCGKRGNGPAVYYDFENFSGKVGFISAMTHKFCQECNRLRLTADGHLKSCLNYEDGKNLKEMLRGGAERKEIEEAIGQVIAAKGEGHCFGGHCDNADERIMSQIGG